MASRFRIRPSSVSSSAIRVTKTLLAASSRGSRVLLSLLVWTGLTLVAFGTGGTGSVCTEVGAGATGAASPPEGGGVMVVVAGTCGCGGTIGAV